MVNILFRLEVKGRENLPSVGSFILASNHASYLDPVVLAAACPRQLNFMARHDLFTIPFFGAFIRSVRAFPLRRNFPDIASIKEALRRLGQEEGLLLFPQGSRSFKGMSPDARLGIGFMAVKSQAPVVPAFISGSQRALGRHAHFIRPVKIKVYFGKPIYPVKPMHPVRNKISDGLRSTEKVNQLPEQGYPKHTDQEDSYKVLTRRIMQAITQLGQIHPPLAA